MNWMIILFYLLLIDAIIANALSWGGKQHWWQKNLGTFAVHFPLARGWTVIYLALVALLGIILNQTGNLMLPF